MKGYWNWLKVYRKCFGCISNDCRQEYDQRTQQLLRFEEWKKAQKKKLGLFKSLFWQKLV